MIHTQLSRSTLSNHQRAVFFDRDGVINFLVKIDGIYTSPKNVDQFKFLPHVFDSIERVQRCGFLTFIVTNQPGIEDGLQTKEELDNLSLMLLDWLQIDGIYNATDRNSIAYKPENGMLEHFIAQYNIQREHSYIIGDRWKDIVPGHNSGLNTIFVGKTYDPPTEYEHILPDCTCSDIYDACSYIVETDG